MFNVLRRYEYQVTSHYSSLHLLKRFNRLSNYQYLLSYKFVDKFIVDTNHKNGLEVHCINEFGLIYIYNKNTLKLITILHPRPAQIKRYYRSLGLTINKNIKQLINETYKRNNDHNLNEV